MELYDRLFNDARKSQGFKSQENLDAFYAHYDHGKSCPECQKPGPMVELADGMQPTMNSCPVHQKLYADYLETC